MYIFKNFYIFRHLKLEIALAIPASNDEKYNWNNSAGQGLNIGMIEWPDKELGGGGTWQVYITQYNNTLQNTTGRTARATCSSDQGIYQNKLWVGRWIEWENPQHAYMIKAYRIYSNKALGVN